MEVLLQVRQITFRLDTTSGLDPEGDRATLAWPANGSWTGANGHFCRGIETCNNVAVAF